MMVHVIGWALIHSLWQGALIAMALAALLWATRGFGPGVRHVSCVVALLCMMVLPAVTAMRQGGLGNESVAAGTIDQAAAGAAAQVSAASDQNAKPHLGEFSRLQRVGAATMRIGSATVSVEALLPWVVGLWVFGVLLFSVRSVGGLLWTRRFVKQGTSPAGAAIEQRARELARALRVRAGFRLSISTRARVPMVIGWLRPVILLPTSLLVGLTPSQLDAILAHELAHIRRYDYAINLIQTIAETLFFYHPAVWWISARIREAREHACDDLAVAICGGDRVFYSDVLLTVERWRGARLGLAIGATGSSVVKRIERLLESDKPHVELGTRWFAGVFTILTAVFAAGGVARSPEASATPSEILEQDTVGARPGSVTRYAGSGSLEERWSWAEQRRDNSRLHWIGYAIDGDPSRTEQFYFDDQVQARAGDSWMTGRLRFQSGTRMQFSGVALGPLVGDRANHKLAIFFGVENGAGGPRLSRIHLSNFGIPVHFGGHPLLWLGDVADEESIARITQLLPRARTEDQRVTLIAVVGVHTDARAMLPRLRDWFADANGGFDIRREAARGLGSLALPEALGLLANAARRDREMNLRHVSVEALGHLPLAAATDTLMFFARGLDPRELRRKAVEALGHRKEERVVPFLNEMVRSNRDELRTAALKSLAIMENGIGLDPVIGYARSAAPDLRRDAIFALAHANAPPSAKVLLELVEADPDPAIQDIAVQSLGAVHDHDDALAALNRVARTHPREEIQLKAVSGLGDYYDDERGGRLLLEIAVSHPSIRLQREAVHALENYHEYPIFDGVARLSRSHSNESVRRQAVETYGLNAPVSVAIPYLKTIATEEPSLATRLHALQLLADWDHDAGVPVLRELAVSAADARIRERAAELMARR